MAAKPDAGNDGDVKAPAKSKKLLIIIVAVVVVLALGGGGAFFYISKQRAAAADPTQWRQPSAGCGRGDLHAGAF
mgnify:CR=1 FL=1